MALHHYLPQDRLRALAEGRALPGLAQGAALFADISGFTALTEALARRHGEGRGVEALTQTVGAVYDRLITEVERFAGSTLAFAGDAITCWFDAADDAAAAASAAARAVQAALALQAVMHGLSHEEASLTLKVSVASGAARRFTVGDAAIQTLDVLAGTTVARVARADALARPGDILLDEATASALSAPVLAWRQHPGGSTFALLDPAWRGPLPGHIEAPPPAVVVPGADVLRPWVLPFVFERESSGQGLFVTDLRPVVALFLRFGDLEGSEGEGALDDAGIQVLDRRITRAQRVVQAHGGALLELTMGDKGSYLYATFGAAQAHEDDALRALRAALELRAAFDDGASGAGAAIGLTSGTLRVGGYGGRTRQSFGAQGDTVNAAARLMMLARPGEILTSGRVRAAVAPEFAMQARAPMALKGKSEPMPVFALLGLRRQRAIRLQEPDFVLPMVGRDEAVQQLERGIERAGGGRGAVVVVTAEAGMGKSRLLAEGIRLALRRGFVGYGGATTGDATRTPYRAWQGVWAALLDLDPGQSPRLQARAIEAALAQHAPAHADAWPLLGPVLGLELPDNAFTQALGPRDRKAVLETLLVETLRGAAGDAALDGGGLLLVLEDMHAAEALSLDLLAAMVRAIADWPLLLLVSQRPSEGADAVDVAQHLASVLGDSGLDTSAPVQRIELSGLDPTVAEQMIRAKLAAQFPERADAVPRALIERIVERAQGNPFYIEELLNHLHDRGLDPLRTDAVQALEWPVSLRSLVLSRIDRLSVPQQLALKVASVIGRRFALAELQACHPNAGSADDLRADVAALARLELTPELMGESEPSFVFKHAVTLEVAYDSMAQDTRMRLHEQVARHLEVRHASALAPVAGALAHHWSRAERPDQAWPHLARSAQQAAAGYANEEALAAFAQVLAWLPTDAPAERIDVMLRCEALYDLLGRHDERRRLLAELDPLADRQSSPEQTATLRRRLGLRRAALALDSGDLAMASSEATTALESTAGSGSATAEHAIEALLLLARAEIAAGRAEQARVPLDKAQALARENGLQRSESLALAQLGLVEWQTGHYDAAESLFMAALPALREAGDLRRELDLLNNLGAVAHVRARHAQAVTQFEQAQAIARRIGDRSGEAMMLNNIGSASLAAGDFHRAALETERAIRIWSALNESSRLGAALVNRAEAHRELGQYDAAAAMGERALGLIRSSGRRRVEATVLENLGRVAAAQGDRAAAMERFQAALALARDIELPLIEASTLLDIGRLQTVQGEREPARAALAAAGALMVRLGDPLGALEVHAAQADLLLGDTTRPEAERARAAREALAPVLPRLLERVEDEAALPMALYLVARRVLEAAGDAHASALLARARAELRERATRIPDPGVRRDYLQMAEHRALLAD